MSKSKRDDTMMDIVVSSKQFKINQGPVEDGQMGQKIFSPLRAQNIIIDTQANDQKGMGWLRGLPDFRDYSIKTDLDQVSESRKMNGVTRSIKKMANETGISKASLSLPGTINLTPWFSPIEDQGQLGSCTANAGVGILEYFERRAFGKHIDASRLFLYKATRDLLHWTGDTGAYLRSTMEAMTVFGVPPEEYWPYRIANFDVEPSAFCFSFAKNYQAISYFTLDPAGTDTGALLNQIKTCLAAGIPSMFGFTCYNSLYQANSTGKIPYPANGEYVVGGHAIVVAGYDDTMEITNTNNGQKTTGAFLIRNSWGTGWGNNGYGWLPYKFVLEGLATDWWCMLRAEWVDTGKFKV